VYLTLNTRFIVEAKILAVFGAADPENVNCYQTLAKTRRLSYRVLKYNYMIYCIETTSDRDSSTASDCIGNMIRVRVKIKVKVGIPTLTLTLTLKVNG